MLKAKEFLWQRFLLVYRCCLLNFSYSGRMHFSIQSGSRNPFEFVLRFRHWRDKVSSEKFSPPAINKSPTFYLSFFSAKSKASKIWQFWVAETTPAERTNERPSLNVDRGQLHQLMLAGWPISDDKESRCLRDGRGSVLNCPAFWKASRICRASETWTERRFSHFGVWPGPLGIRRWVANGPFAWIMVPKRWTFECQTAHPNLTCREILWEAVQPLSHALNLRSNSD